MFFEIFIWIQRVLKKNKNLIWNYDIRRNLDFRHFTNIFTTNLQNTFTKKKIYKIQVHYVVLNLFI